MATMDLLAGIGCTPANFMDLGGQIYHEKLTHSIILMENLNYVGAVLTVMWCGQLDGHAFSYTLQEAYRKGYITKPMVICMKGRGAEEGRELLTSIRDEFPQIHIESDWNKAAALVKDLAHEHMQVI